MNEKKTNALYPMVFVGMMAALIFVATHFIRIEIPTPTGPTNLKVGNILCLLGGMLFGGLYGGLAAGIGSVFFDLLNPAYVSSAPFTLVFFFIMGAVCGTISHMNGKKGLDTKLNIVAAVSGAMSYWLLYIGKSVIVLMLAGSAFGPALVATVPKMITSGVNVITASVFSVLLAKPMHSALEKIGVFKKMNIK